MVLFSGLCGVGKTLTVLFYYFLSKSLHGNALHSIFVLLKDNKTTTIMKIKAKEVKQGMTIKWGVVTITVEQIETFTQKNGKTGKVFYGPAIRSFGRGVRPSKYSNYDIEVKDETFVTVK